MDVYEAIRTVLAVRQFQDKPVPAEIIGKIVESARLTSSSRNGQPWHFIVVENRATLRKLGEIATTGPYTADAAFAVVVAYEKASEFGVSDASMAVHSMMLTGWGEGVGSNWVGFANRFAALHDLLGLPETYDVLAILPFGYPVKEIGKGKKRRKELGEVASRERFGQPFA
ncbi:MAG: nitroreductase family protein [Chloroflexi bacterium]|nr:nitroreductase family protein [Chloroflexota bacterium]